LLIQNLILHADAPGVEGERLGGGQVLRLPLSELLNTIIVEIRSCQDTKKHSAISSQPNKTKAMIFKTLDRHADTLTFFAIDSLQGMC
jgi:hypothetical protein